MALPVPIVGAQVPLSEKVGFVMIPLNRYLLAMPVQKPFVVVVGAIDVTT
jgi:hypothetical protein